MRHGFKEFVPRTPIDLHRMLKFSRWQLPLREKYQPLLDGRYGIEVGGPSAIFKRQLPVYPLVGGLDGVNFGTDTVWEGKLEAGNNYGYYFRKSGRQYISEASDLSEVQTGQYDFLLSSNCLEHCANALKTLTEWRRVIKPGGAFVLVLPKKESNFDHRRAVTTFEHLLDDFAKDVGEDDLTHLDEILEFHDRSMDPASGTLEQFRARSLKNFENRCLHHHVFDAPLMEKMLDHVGFDLVDLTTTVSDFFALATKNDKIGLTSE